MDSIHSDALATIVRDAEAVLAGENLAFTRIAGGVPGVGDGRAVLSIISASTAAAAEVNVGLGVDACVGVAAGEVGGHVADSLAGRAGQDF